jgi:hypothetical protein
MNVSINSFPRSGTQFTQFNLNRIIGHQAVQKMPPSLVDIRTDESYFQIVVIRSPKDTVLSCIAHAEYNSPGTHKNIKKAIVDNLKHYCESIDLFAANLQYINLYDFNYLEWAFFDIANKIGLEVPDGFELKYMPDDADPTFWSVSGTDFYKELLDYEIEDSLFDEANEKYEAILKFCQRPSL